MDFRKISEAIQGAEGIIFGSDRTLYIREDEVLRLILKFAYNIDYLPTEENNDFEEEGNK